MILTKKADNEFLFVGFLVCRVKNVLCNHEKIFS